MSKHLKFLVVVKNTGFAAAPWRWEIYRADRKSPILQASEYFQTITEASHEGKHALRLFLSEFQD